MKRQSWIVASITIALVAGLLYWVKNAQATKPEHDKVVICHRTNAVTNPYQRIEVDESAVDGDGQNDHTLHIGPVATSQAVAQQLKDSHIKWGDIIPNVLNWTEQGQTVYRNDCKFVTPPGNDDQPDNPDNPQNPKSPDVEVPSTVQALPNTSIRE